MNLKNCTIIVVLFALLAACSTGKKALERGDYYEATIQAVKFLRNTPDSKKAKETISQSYPMALDYYKQQVDAMALSNAPDKYLSIVEIYTKQNNLADEISRCPAALEEVKPVVYFHDQLKKAQEMAIDEQYNAAVQLLSSGFIEDARKAYDKLEWVNKTSPGYADVNIRLLEAESLATLRIVIEKLPYMGDRYEANLNSFYDRIMADLVRNSQQRFLKFYKPQEAEKLKIAPHHIIKMEFVDFSIGNLFEKETEKEYVSDTIVVNTYKDDKGVSHDIKGTVKAKVNTHERDIVSRGILDLKILDYQTNTLLSNKRFPGEYTWRNDWATFNGDERAVPEKIKALTKVKQTIPPDPQDLFILFSNPLAANASSYLKSYYKEK